MDKAHLARLLSGILSGLVSLVSLRMALRSLSAKTWLPFHAAAAGVEWASLAPRSRLLLLFMVRAVGLGFLALFFLLAIVPASLAWDPEPLVCVAILLTGTTYCAGLGTLTLWLHRETAASTPWRGAFAAAAALVTAALLSVLGT